MSVVHTLDLDQAYKERALRVKALEEEISRLERLVQTKKSSHAQALNNLCKVNIYKERAKYNNQNRYFKWTESKSLRYENNSKQYNNSLWEYNTPTLSLKIKIKHRNDLKVWKYELYITGNKIHFENYEFRHMYERTLKNYWSHSHLNFLTEHYPGEALNRKFKTEQEALEHVEEWKKELESNLSFEINYDKTMYEQAVAKYDESVFVQINHECSKVFYEKLEEYNLSFEKEDYYNLEIKGQKVKELMLKLKEVINFTILAG